MIPEQLRSPSLYIKANSRMQLSPGGVSGDTGPGIEFRGNSISLGVGGNSAFDIDPQGKAGTDKKVSEANFMRFFEIGGLALWAFTLPTRNLDHDPTTLPPRAIARY